jgi:hypothetical protein
MCKSTSINFWEPSSSPGNSPGHRRGRGVVLLRSASHGEYPFRAGADGSDVAEGSSWMVVSNMNFIVHNMGVSENSVPLNPMVNDHYPY